MAGPLSGGLGAPDLLGAAEMKPDSKIDYCMVLVFKFIDMLEKKVPKVLVYVMISMCLSHLLTMARPLTLAFFSPEIGLVRGCMDEQQMKAKPDSPKSQLIKQCIGLALDSYAQVVKMLQSSYMYPCSRVFRSGKSIFSPTMQRK